MPDINSPDRFKTSWGAIKKLTRKTAEELKDWRQLKNPDRARELFDNGWVALVAASRKIDTEIGKIELKINHCYRENRTKNGLVVATALSKGLSLQILKFPPDSIIDYVAPAPVGECVTAFRRNNVRFVFDATTVGEMDQNDVEWPNLGYYGPENKVPFRDTDPELIPQYGGLVIKNQQINIVDYFEIQKYHSTETEPDERVLMTNWYANDQNCYVAAATKEHQYRQTYNCLGIGTNNLGQRVYFHVSCSPTVYRDLFRENQKISEETPSLFEMVAFTRIFSKRNRLENWQLAGLEYSGGRPIPILPDERPHTPAHHFAISYGKASKTAGQPHLENIFKEF